MTEYLIGAIVFAVVGIVGFTAIGVVQGTDPEEITMGIGVILVATMIWPVMLAIGILMLLGWGIGKVFLRIGGYE